MPGEAGTANATLLAAGPFLSGDVLLQEGEEMRF